MENKSRSKKRYWQYLFLLSPFFLAAGFSAGFLTGEWGIVPVTFIVLGGAIAWAALVYKINSDRGFWGRYSTETSINALFSTAAILAILAAVNFLGAKYAASIDLTENKRFTLSPQSQEVVANLETPAKLWVFSIRPAPEEAALLDNYERVSDGNFAYEYVDPQADLGRVQEFGVTQFGDVYLEVGDRRQFVQNISDRPLSEVELTNSLVKLVAGSAQKIYFLSGHGEKSLAAAEDISLSSAVAALQERNYAVEPLNLVEAETVPDDAAVVVVAGPTGELFESEVEALRTYLDRGGSLFLAIDPDTDPGVEPLLADWGLSLDDRLAIDPERWMQGLGPAAPVAVDYGVHPITEDFANNFSIYPVVRPIVLDSEDDRTFPLVFTSDASWAESDLEESPDWEFDPQSDRRGPLVLAVASSRFIDEGVADSDTDEVTETDAENEAETDSEAVETETLENDAVVTDTDSNEVSEETEDNADVTNSDSEEVGDKTSSEDATITDSNETETESDVTDSDTEETTLNPESRLVVFGDSDFMADGFFNGQLNGDIFLNSIAWLSQDDDRPLSIRPRTAENRRFEIDPRQARFLTWTALGTFPVAGFAASLILWWTRRRSQ